MTDDEIQARVNRAPELARELIVPPKLFGELKRIQEKRPKAEWEWLGFKVRSDPMLSDKYALWVDAQGVVLSVMNLED